MFSTLVVILPSEYTGGEIHVSHGGKNMVFDTSKDSAFETTIVAWYTDVTHEVKEITSGYRLALSYYLINTSPGISAPQLPSDDSVLQHLRSIFSRWSKGGYPSFGHDKFLAYVFAHEYSSVSLREAILKGKDQHIASILKHAGDAEEVFVLMGLLTAQVEGCTSSESWAIYDGDGDGPQYGFATGSMDCPVMSHVFETKFWVEDIRDMQGKSVEISKINLDEDCIFPFNPFRDVDPTESKMHEGHWGNVRLIILTPLLHTNSHPSRKAQMSNSVSGPKLLPPNPSINVLNSVYQCAALVMLPKHRQLSFMLSSEGKKWALKELKKSKSEGPSKENREIIYFLAQQNDERIMTTVSGIAIEWGDTGVWDQIVQYYPDFFLSQEGFTELYNGWRAFGFDVVHPT